MEMDIAESTIATQLSDHEPAYETTTDSLRVDHLIDSRHKFLSPSSRVITVEHCGKNLRLALPSHSPACDFHVTSASDDFLFLIGSQRPGRGGETYRGAVVVARKGKDGVYATELWHETHLSFVMRVSRDLSS
jgi:hypothetical protein